MTTKFEHSIINPLTRNNNFAVIIPHYYPKPKPPSMDRIVESQKIESMRKKMLMQEQLFKHQVQELHRLYNQQRKAMQEIENGLKQRKERADIAKRPHHHHQTESISKQSFQPFSATNQSSSAEKAPTPIKFALESTPSSSTRPFEDKLKKMDEVEVELTLSIGSQCTRRKRRSKSAEIQDSQEVASSSSTKTDNAVSGMSSSSVYQETTRPHWLMQDLSLNRT